MSPTVLSGDVVLVSKLAYGFRMPGAGSIVAEWKQVKRGDLVLIGGVGDPPLSLLRRVTGMPGDSVQLPDEKVPHILASDEYTVSASDPEAGFDSRQFGVVSRRAIIGKAEYLWLQGENASPPGQSQIKSGNQPRRMLQPIL